MVKLLVSVDRKKGFDDAKENIDLAIELAKRYAKYLVGIDLSGDPTSGGAFIDLLNDCRKAGLKITAHCAEVREIDRIDDYVGKYDIPVLLLHLNRRFRTPWKSRIY